MFVVSRGFRIRFEVWGHGPALVLLHGHPMWGERWVDRGYVAALRDRFRVIVPDLLGHGDSDKPSAVSDYGMFNLASDVVAVLDDQGIEQADLWGYSMGTMVAEAVAMSASERVRSLILGGFPPGLDLQQRRELFPPDAIATNLDERFEGWPEPLAALYKSQNDLAAMQAIEASYCLEAVTIEDLQSAPHPVMAYIGAEDGSLELTRQQCASWPCPLAIVPGNHFEGFLQSENVLPLAMSHLESSAEWIR